MSTRLVAVLAGAPGGGSTLGPAALADEVVDLRDASLKALAAIAESAAILWLPAWSRLDEDLAARVAGWRAGGPDALLFAHPVLHSDASTTPLPRLLLGAPPGGARPAGASLVPRAEALPAGPEPVALSIVPPLLSLHLRGVDAQSAAAARLADEAGATPSILGLAVRPLGMVLRSLVATRGDRRAALACASVEAYRDVLTQAKLWERRGVDRSEGT